MKSRVEQSSFRDRDGFVFFKDKACYRAIHRDYAPVWEQLMQSGLYQDLVQEGKLISVEPCDTEAPEGFHSIHKIVKVPLLPVISYPGEWSFSQLKQAALLTLYIQKKAIEKGFCLKDASAYNLQFVGNKILFIDSLSFDHYRPDEPWQAYAQFCRHFLAPLLLAHYGLSGANQYFLSYIDGIPLSLCSALLPWKSRFHLLASTHIHLHARLEKKHAGDRFINLKGRSYSAKKMKALLEHLEMEIKSLRNKHEHSHWDEYYETFSYSEAAFRAKSGFVETICAKLKGKLCLDLGANSGAFSFLAARHFEQVLACDNDEQVLRAIRKQKQPNVLTLQVNLNNPLPAYGWNSTERASFIDRVKHNDLTLALALMHHLCISNNVPFTKLAEFFNTVCRQLIIEFVPKEDSQVKKLLVSRKDVFPDYNQINFEAAFSQYYEKCDELSLPDSGRVLYYFRRKKEYAET